MGLQSRLFRGDPKLEAAAVSDPAHITNGMKGEHVRKIQLALTLLDGATIAQDGAYGPETAAAVLAYKQKRNIVNRSYQTQAGNIVGKMTIAALDLEMLKREQPTAPYCVIYALQAGTYTIKPKYSAAIPQFLGSAWGEVAAQERFDLARFCVEKLCQDLRVVTMQSQPWFQP